MAIGSGAWPLSLLTRFISRNLACCVNFEAMKPPDIDDPALAAEVRRAMRAGLGRAVLP